MSSTAPATAARTVAVDAAEWDRVREVLDAARDWQEQLPPAGEACPDCGSAGEPGTERRLDDAVKRLWSTDGGATPGQIAAVAPSMSTIGGVHSATSHGGLR